MSTMNHFGHRFSEPMVCRGNHDRGKINKANSKSSLIDRRYSWTGEVEKASQWNGKHHAGKRPSTADSAGRNSHSDTNILYPKSTTDIALYPLFKSQSTQTCKPKTSLISTQYKPNASKLKSTTGGFMNPAVNYSNALERPKTSFASTAWKSHHKNGMFGSNSGLINPFLSFQNISARTNSSITSGSWRTPCRKSTSEIKPKKSSLHSFPERYQELCERYRQLPLPGVKNHLSKGILDLTVDRLKAEDWRPLLEALYTDRQLHKIVIRSRYPARKVMESRDNLQRAMPATRCPVIFSQYFLVALTSSLAHCLTNSNSLTSLELEGILLSPKYLSILTEGLVKSKHLQHLSFEKCFIGDDGLASICMALKQLPRVLTLNVTMCSITSTGIGHLVSLLKVQKMNRFMETWQQSLRYQIPNLDTMWGLRRITLNHNPSIGDEGIAKLCDILDDDLWVKGIDLQRSGVGKAGANRLIDLLHFNVTLAIVDIRENKNVPSSLTKKIMQLLSRNNKDQKIEYQWINSTSSTQFERKPKVFAERSCTVNKNQTNPCVSASSPVIGTKKLSIYLRNRAYSQPLRG